MSLQLLVHQRLRASELLVLFRHLVETLLQRLVPGHQLADLLTDQLLVDRLLLPQLLQPVLQLVDTSLSSIG